jgi:hypothetical protein
LFHEGRRLYGQKDYPAALAKFEAAANLYRSYRIELNIAFTKDRLGRSAEAAHVFERYLIEHPNSEKQASAMVLDRLTQIRRELAMVTVDATVNGAVFEVVGEAQYAIPIRHRIYLSPGRHRLRVTEETRVLYSREVDLRPGQHFWVRLDRIAATQAPDEARIGGDAVAPAPRSKPLYKKWWFWTLVGAVVAGTAVGIVAGTSAGGMTGSPAVSGGRRAHASAECRQLEPVEQRATRSVKLSAHAARTGLHNAVIRAGWRRGRPDRPRRPGEINRTVPRETLRRSVVDSRLAVH